MDVNTMTEPKLMIRKSGRSTVVNGSSVLRLTHCGKDAQNMNARLTVLIPAIHKIYNPPSWVKRSKK